LEEKGVFVPPPEQLTNLKFGPSCKTKPVRAAEVKGIVIKFTMDEDQQTGPSSETWPKKLKFISVINDSLLEEKEIFVPLPEQLTNLQSRQSCKTRPIRAAKA
jgi:hypothetical protein